MKPLLAHAYGCAEALDHDDLIPRPVPMPQLPPAILSLVAIALAAAAVAGCGGGDEEAPEQPRLDVQAQVGGALVAVEASADSVWVLDNTAGTAQRLDPESGEPLGRAARVGGGPSAIALGEQAVWVASGDDRVSQIDPATGKVQRLAVRVADPGGIAVGEGSVWVSSRADSTLTRLEESTGEQVGEPIEVGASPGEVAVGEGAVWVGSTGEGTLARVDPGSGEVVSEIAVAETVLAVAVGEGAVWVASSDERLGRDIEVRRVDPGSEEVGEGAVTAAGNPVGLAAGEGAVWATLAADAFATEEPEATGLLALDPDGLGSLGELATGERTADVSVGAGAVWTVDADGTVSRVVPG